MNAYALCSTNKEAIDQIGAALEAILKSVTTKKDYAKLDEWVALALRSQRQGAVSKIIQYIGGYVERAEKEALDECLDVLLFSENKSAIAEIIKYLEPALKRADGEELDKLMTRILSSSMNAIEVTFLKKEGSGLSYLAAWAGNDPLKIDRVMSTNLIRVMEQLSDKVLAAYFLQNEKWLCFVLDRLESRSESITDHMRSLGWAGPQAVLLPVEESQDFGVVLSTRGENTLQLLMRPAGPESKSKLALGTFTLSGFELSVLESLRAQKQKQQLIEEVIKPILKADMKLFGDLASWKSARTRRADKGELVVQLKDAVLKFFQKPLLDATVQKRPGDGPAPASAPVNKRLKSSGEEESGAGGGSRAVVAAFYGAGAPAPSASALTPSG